LFGKVGGERGAAAVELALAHLHHQSRHPDRERGHAVRRLCAAIGRYRPVAGVTTGAGWPDTCLYGYFTTAILPVAGGFGSADYGTDVLKVVG
jgi:hypothetical protein